MKPSKLILTHLIPVYTVCFRTCTIVSGGIRINGFGNGYVNVTGSTLGTYEILHYARFLNGSTITTTIKGEIKRRTSSGGGNEAEIEEVDRTEMPKLP